MRLSISFVLPFVLATSLCAQTQLVRGKVEDANGGPGFVLACTTVPLTSTVLNLNTLVGQQWDLQVVDLGTPGQPRLDVRAATAATPFMDMGNLRLTQTSRWNVLAPAGTSAWVFVAPTALTGYLPAGAPGAWLLQPAAMRFLAFGVTNAANVFEFSFAMPNVPELVGASITSQAVLLAGATLTLTDADCKTVEAR